MEILKHFLTFAVGYGVILVGDAIFLGRVMHGFIIEKFGPLVESTDGSINMNLPAGIFAWFIIVMMIYVFVNQSGLASTYSGVMFWGAIMGGLMYSMYEFTNLTFLKDYPVSFVFIDILWGVFLCSAVATAMFAAGKWFESIL